MIKLDARDIEILRLLSQEGRISKSDLAARINLSPTPCWERLKRLEKSGVIESYRAEIALHKIAPCVTIFVAVELENHRASSFQLFEQSMKNYDEVIACWAIGGGLDYFMQVVTKDIDAYQRLIDEMLEAKIGLARYFTYFVTKPVKQGGVPPIAELLD
ncbi:Lrp/AsnC family transcriptional regulator [Maritalea mediterranea]|uniref:Lrp/AsnC family transcriptional regulator n=1 Tax=Maritalea mediterranea TaxID=2909667 RepID=A0ABS9E4R8_9HYPH|nr:Lrp/AsnC family transcriptional regulator [Maritalea mediterranea]MCF4097254.1 Lrp/AsnC family transcriptional regulator [Maritalea mediterranea]